MSARSNQPNWPPGISHNCAIDFASASTSNWAAVRRAQRIWHCPHCRRPWPRAGRPAMNSSRAHRPPSGHHQFQRPPMRPPLPTPTGTKCAGRSVKMVRAGSCAIVIYHRYMYNSINGHSLFWGWMCVNWWLCGDAYVSASICWSGGNFWRKIGASKVALMRIVLSHGSVVLVLQCKINQRCADRPSKIRQSIAIFRYYHYRVQGSLHYLKFGQNSINTKGKQLKSSPYRKCAATRPYQYDHFEMRRNEMCDSYCIPFAAIGWLCWYFRLCPTFTE